MLLLTLIFVNSAAGVGGKHPQSCQQSTVDNEAVGVKQKVKSKRECCVLLCVTLHYFI